MMLRVITCDICGKSEQEEQPGNGFVGWGALQGIALDEIPNPTVCPEHLAALAEAADKLKEAFR